MKQQSELTQEQRLLSDALFEIKLLRKSNDEMSGKLRMFDNCMMLLTARINQEGVGMLPDKAWEIEQYLLRLESIPPK